MPNEYGHWVGTVGLYLFLCVKICVFICWMGYWNIWSVLLFDFVVLNLVICISIIVISFSSIENKKIDN